MNKIQYAGIFISSFGSLVVILWIFWKLIESLELPDELKIGFTMLIGGLLIIIVSLMYERNQDVKKERSVK